MVEIGWLPPHARTCAHGRGATSGPRGDQLLAGINLAPSGARPPADITLGQQVGSCKRAHAVVIGRAAETTPGPPAGRYKPGPDVPCHWAARLWKNMIRHVYRLLHKTVRRHQGEHGTLNHAGISDLARVYRLLSLDEPPPPAQGGPSAGRYKTRPSGPLHSPRGQARTC